MKFSTSRYNGCEPPLTGDTIESRRYRKRPPTTIHLETLAEALVGYAIPQLDAVWLTAFLESAQHPYPAAVCARLFPDREVDLTPSQDTTTVHLPPPPLQSYRPPSTAGFVGRGVELERYRSRLAADAIVIITGMAGIGKTSLAATLAVAEAAPTHTFWHRFHPGDAMPLIRRLAGFLAHHGRPVLWEAFESARIAGIDPPAVISSMDTLTPQLQGRSLLLCFDDLQFADHDRQVQSFITGRRDSAPYQSGRLLPAHGPPGSCVFSSVPGPGDGGGGQVSTRRNRTHPAGRISS